MSFAVVDLELWLLYVYNPLAVQGPVTQTTPLRFYELNYKGQCNQKVYVNTIMNVFCVQILIQLPGQTVFQLSCAPVT